MALFKGMILVEEDGVTHLNVYSKARTKLGKFLSNFAHTPLETEDGRFESLEGYWYWLRNRNEEMRSLHGYEAKRLGKMFAWHVPQIGYSEFEAKFKAALTAKLNAYPGALEDLKKCDLPLTHYYVFSGVVKEAGHLWVIEHLDSLRQ